MRLHRKLLLLFFLSLSTTTQAQQFSTEFFNVKDGLPQSQVATLAEDKKLGYLWVGTQGGGLARFDGKTFTSYDVEDGLRDNNVSKVFIDSRDNVWVGTARGLCKFDGKSFRSFDSLRDNYAQIVEFNDTIFALSRNNSRLVKIWNDSVYCNCNCGFTKGKQVRFLASNSPDCMYFIEDPKMLVRRDKLGSRRIDLTTLEDIYGFMPIQDFILVVTSKGTYRFGKEGLQLLDAKIDFPILFMENDLATVWQRSTRGLIKATRQASGFHRDTIKFDAVALVGLEDVEHNIWFGTGGNGLMKHTNNDFELVKSDITMGVVKSGERLWVATLFHGLDVMEGNKVVRHFDIESLGRRLTSIKEDKRGNIWVAATSNISVIDPSYRVKRFTEYDGLKTGSVISCVELDSAQNIWISYRGEGIQYGDGKTFRDFDMNPSLSSPNVIGIKYVPYGNRLLVLTVNGVNEVRNGQVSRLNIPTFGETAVLCAASYERKYVIIGSDGKGICLVDLDNGLVKHFSKKDGLVSGLIYFVNVDDQGYVWIGSNLGVEKVKFNKNLEMEEYVYFSEASGLKGLETNLNASFISGKDLYVGSVDGLYLHDRSRASSSRDFPLHFTSIELLDADYPLSGYSDKKNGFFKVAENPRMPYDQNSIQFFFSKVSKKYPGSTQYKFKLEGLEDGWTSQKVAKEVSYRNLPPGPYSFRVMARDAGGKWTDHSLEYPFYIAPPFYKTTLFITLSILVALLIITLAIYVTIRRKVARVLALEELKANENVKLRKEIGRDFHDELGNQLARIINYISLIKLNHTNSMEILSAVQDSAKGLIVGTKDFIWALDHENDSVSKLYVNLRDFGERLFAEKHIEFRTHYEIQRDTKFPIGYTRHLTLIFKEAMTNCFKHANGTRADLRCEQFSSELRISLKDNGVGIPPDKRDSNLGGLANIKKRAELINAQFTLHSNCQGTEMSIYLTF